MTDNNSEIEVTGDQLLKAVVKSELLIEEHEDAMEDLNNNQEDIGSWITVIFRALKEALL